MGWEVTARQEKSGLTAEVAGAAATRDGSVPAGSTRVHPNPMPGNWWLRRRTLRYVLRDLSSLVTAIWMVVFLVEIARLHGGAAQYQPFGGALFVAFSLVCLAFAVGHSYTFLGLAGQFMRIPVGERFVPGWLIVVPALGAGIVGTAVIGFLLAWGGR